MKRGDPEVTRLVVVCLRSYANMKQEEFAKASRADQGDLSRYEQGRRVPPEESLQRMAKAAGVPWPVVVELRRSLTAFLGATKGWAAAVSDGSEGRERAVLESVLLAYSTYEIEDGAARYQQALEREKAEAVEAWAALALLPAAERERLVGLGLPVVATPALLAHVCAESERAAAHRVADAFEVTDFALFLAERVPCEEAYRPFFRAYALAHVSNVHRAADDLKSADRELARAWGLWPAREGPVPEPLSESRLLDLKASLRRDQHSFEEALTLLDRALAACGSDPGAAARLWLKKEHVFDTMGDRQAALAALEKAAPLVERSGDPTLLFTLRFNTADHTCSLRRYGEAAKLLPQVRELAQQQGELHQVRVRWLAARIDAGLGHAAEAIAALVQVQRDFTTHELAYEAALASLDLALLWLEAGHTAEVRELALEMAWVFKAKEIHREALASLAIFVDAAQQETATVELTRKVIADIEKAHRS